MTQEKVRENRLRRMAGRQGMILHKNPQRDPRAINYGTYMLNLPRGGSLLMWVSLDEVEAFLTGRKRDVLIEVPEEMDHVIGRAHELANRLREQEIHDLAEELERLASTANSIVELSAKHRTDRHA